MATDSSTVTHPTGDGPRQRGDLSVFVATSVSKDPRGSYRDTLESIRTAEVLGYSHAWVTETHFNAHLGLPAALTLLAAASQITHTIRIGPAVVPLAFENPLRLAETAAVVNVLSDHRLEFGVGKGNPKGFSTDAYNAFELDEGERDGLFARALETLKATLRGTVRSGEKEVSLYPPSEDLLGRIWQATGEHPTAAAAGAANDGLLLYRTAPGGPAGDSQTLLVDTYLRSLPEGHGEPRIGVSRAVLLAPSRHEALRIAKADFETRADEHPRRPEGTDLRSVEEFLVEMDIAFGSADDLVEQLNNDKAVNRSTSYLFSLPFAPTGSPRYVDGLAALASDVYPGLRLRDDAFRPRTEGALQAVAGH